MSEKIQIIEESVFKQLEKLDKELSKVLETLKDIVKEGAKITFDMKGAKTIEDFSKASEQATTNTSKLTTEQKELLKIQRQIEIQEARLSSAYVEEVKRLQEAKDKVKALNEVEEEELGTLEKIEKRNKALREERKKLNIETDEGKKRLQEINNELNSNNDIIRENVDLLAKQKINIGNYKEDVKSAIGEMGIFGQVLNTVNETLEKGKSVAKLFGVSVKTALIETGIGALLVAFGALFSYFTKTIGGSEKLRVGMAGVKQIGIELQNSFSKLGEKIANIDWAGTFETAKKYIPFAREISAVWNLSRDALEKLNPEMKKHREEVEANIKAAQDLESVLIAYEKEKVKIELVNAQLENQRNLKAAIADDDSRSFKEREAAAIAVIELDKKINKSKVDLALSELQIVQEKRKLDKQNNDLLKEENQLTIDLERIKGEATIQNMESTKNLSMLRLDMFEQELDYILDIYDRQKMVAEQQLASDKYTSEQKAKIQNDLKDADVRNQNEIVKLYEKYTGKKIDLNNLVAEKNIENLNEVVSQELGFSERAANRLKEVITERTGYNQDLQTLDNDTAKVKEDNLKKGYDLEIQLIEQSKKNNEEYAAWEEEQAKKKKEEKEKDLQELVEKVRLTNETLAEIGETRLNNIEVERQIELKLAGDNKEKQKKINEKYDKEEAKVKRRQAIREKAMALFELGLILAKQLASAQYFKAAMTSAQMIAVAAKKVPEFAKGVIDFKGGEAIIGEKGREILLDRTGKAYLSPDQATLTNLPAGASVIPNNETERILAQLPVHQQRVKEFRPRENALILELLKSNKRLENVIKRKKFVGINIDEKGFSSFMQQENSKTNIYSSYFRSKA